MGLGLKMLKRRKCRYFVLKSVLILFNFISIYIERERAILVGGVFHARKGLNWQRYRIDNCLDVYEYALFKSLGIVVVVVVIIFFFFSLVPCACSCFTFVLGKMSA